MKEALKRLLKILFNFFVYYPIFFFYCVLYYFVWVHVFITSWVLLIPLYLISCLVYCIFYLLCFFKPVRHFLLFLFEKIIFLPKYLYLLLFRFNIIKINTSKAKISFIYENLYIFFTIFIFFLLVYYSEAILLLHVEEHWKLLDMKNDYSKLYKIYSELVNSKLYNVNLPISAIEVYLIKEESALQAVKIYKIHNDFKVLLDLPEEIYAKALIKKPLYFYVIPYIDDVSFLNLYNIY